MLASPRARVASRLLLPAAGWLSMMFCLVAALIAAASNLVVAQTHPANLAPTPPTTDSAVAQAAPLADHLPANTVAYFGWKPGQNVQQTRLFRMLADEQFMVPLRSLLQDQALRMPDDVGGAKISENLPKMIDDITHCPGCIALLQVTEGKNSLQPQAMLVLQLGQRAAAFREHFQPIHERLKQRLGDSMKMMQLNGSWLWYKMEKGQPRFTWGFIGDSFVFFWGNKGPDLLPTIFGSPAATAPATSPVPQAAPASPAQSLAANPNFRDSLAAIHPPQGASPQPVCISYVDAKIAPLVIKTFINASDDSDLKALLPKLPKLLQVLGLDNAKALVRQTFIQNDEFVTQSLLHTDGPPHGLLTQLIQGPVDESMLKCIPSDAMYAVAFRLDLANFYQQLKADAIAVGGDDASKAFEAFEAKTFVVGLSPKQALAPLGDQWVIYNAASTGGWLFTGATLVGTVRDPAKLQATIDTVRNVVGALAGGDSNVTVAEETVDGVKIQFLQLGQFFSPISPAWAVTGDHVYVAFYPQLVEDAIRQTKSHQSILDNPDFNAARNRIGSGGPLFYYSGPEIVKSIYPFAPMLMSVMQNMSGMMEADASQHSPEKNWLLLLPSMQRLLRYVGTDAEVVKVTPQGILTTRSQSNPVLSPLLISDLTLPVIFAANSDDVPGNARQTSAQHLRQIGQSCTIYANENNGKYPPDADTLAKAEGLPDETFKSPFGQATAGPPYVYCYFKSMNGNMPPEIIVAYDKAEFEQEDGTNVLFADGHVDYLEKEAFQKALSKSKEEQATLEKNPAGN